MKNPVPPKWFAYVEATVSPLVATLIGFAVQAVLPRGNISLIYLTAVLIVAVRTRTRPALLCAGISFLAYNFFFTEPHLSLFMMHREDVLTVGFFLLMAALTGHLAARLREQVVALRGREAINQAHFLLSERFSAAIDKREIGEALCDALKNAIAKTCFILDIEPSENTARLPPLCGDSDSPEAVQTAATRLLNSNRIKGASPDGQYYLELIHDHRGPAAVLALVFRDNPGGSNAEREAVVDAFVNQASLALGRIRLVDELQGERLEKERELLRSALLSSISHDLRTPLSAMIGSTTTLIDLEASLDAGQKHELLDAILQEARRLDRYIQNLLDMTRLGYQGLRLDRDWVGLDEIIHVTLKRIKPLTRGHRIDSRLDPGLPPLNVHAALVEQAIFNVLENAVKFSGDNTDISIEARALGGTIQIDITDQGPGVTEAQRRNMFNMFVTGSQGDRQATGTGLGLAICQGAVNAHGGSVEALEGPGGKGLRIRLTLPAAAPGPPEETSRELPEDE